MEGPKIRVTFAATKDKETKEVINNRDKEVEIAIAYYNRNWKHDDGISQQASS